MIPTPIAPSLVDDDLYKAAQKEQLLTHWRRFITHGFQKQDFTAELYRFLHLHCDLPDNGDRWRFWQDFFAADSEALLRFIGQFSASGLNAVYNNHAWLYTAPRDLKLEMCATLAPLAPVLTQLLTGLAQQHQSMINQWQALASIANLPIQPAGRYLVSDNTRQLLAFAAHSIIPLRKQPLNGLQTMFTHFLENPND